MQDLWLLASGDTEDARKAREDLIEGYELFREFDRSTLALAEPLRAMRIIHMSGWIAKRWADPSFPPAFPNFKDVRYWTEEYEALVAIAEAVTQTRPAVDSIRVTAIHLEVLPAASSQLGVPLAQADLANVTCGPNGRAPRTSQPLPAVPTVIDSGTEGFGGVGDYALVAGALVLAGAGGLIAYRRFTARP